ncbi:MAG TPA: hypothetical protein VF542_05345, partial [Jatrophihabitans sp.]
MNLHPPSLHPRSLHPRSLHLRRLGIFAAIGLLAAGVAVGVGELVAALIRPAASPVIAVGNRFILLTPEPVKRFAIERFGTSDKAVLLGGIYLVLAVLAVLIGLLAMRSPGLGLAGIALLGVLGGYCALTAHAARTSDAVPSIAGALAAMAIFTRLVEAVTGTGTGPRRPGTLLADRRRFLQGGLAGAGVAVLGGAGGRALQHRRYDASAARAAIRLPEPVSGPGPLPPASPGAAGATAGPN